MRRYIAAAAMTAADGATSAEFAADSADAKAKAARDNAILVRTQALNARVDKVGPEEGESLVPPHNGRRSVSLLSLALSR